LRKGIRKEGGATKNQRLAERIGNKEERKMLVRYRPFRTLRRRENYFPSLWNHDFFGDFFENFREFNTEEPKLEMKENEKSYLVRGEFPGYGKDEIKAEIVDGVLKLHAEHKDEKWDQDEEEGWRSIETRSGSYTRSFALPEDVLAEKAKAEMKDGVLRITLPRELKKDKEAKQIEIH
jgi:HSP20 family protein